MSDENLFPIDIRHGEQISTLQRDVSGIATRFDRHLEIYAQNGKEMTKMKEEISGLRDDLSSINKFIEKCDTRFITLDQFTPVKLITFGLVAVVLLAVLGAVVQNVLVQQHTSGGDDAFSSTELRQMQDAIDLSINKRLIPTD